MDWEVEAKHLFLTKKPKHFTDFTHCEECAEHDETLRHATIDSIGLAELGSPGWDPICFSNGDGKKYYTPAFIRLSLHTIDREFYFGQYLFHLSYDNRQSNYFLSCSKEQRHFLATFIQHMIQSYPSQIENNSCAEDAFRAHQIWTDEE